MSTTSHFKFPLSFGEARLALLTRLPYFKNAHGELTNPNGVRDWTLSQWSNSMCGETGEAANIVKKIERDGTTPELIQALGYELGDAIAYIIYVAERAGIDLSTAFVDKFNIVSERQSLDIRL